MAKRERSWSPMSASKRQLSISSPTTPCSSEGTSTDSSESRRSMSRSLTSPGPLTLALTPANPTMNKRQGFQQLFRTKLAAKKDILDCTSARSGTSKTIETKFTISTTSEHKPLKSALETPTPSTPGLDYAMDAFPNFETGDVFIECSMNIPPKRWKLHGDVLQRHSAWFKYSMQEASQNSGHEMSWNFQLVDDGDKQMALKLAGDAMSSDNSNISDKQLDASDQGLLTPPASASSDHFPNDTSVHAAETEIYNQLFGAFYTIPLVIPTTSVPATLDYCSSILRVSHQLSITPLIATQLSNALKSHRHSLYTAISRDPARYLLLSILLHDRAIYTESLIHIVGTYPSWPKHWTTRPKALPPALIKLVERKALELTALTAETQRDLLTLTINNYEDEPVTASASSSTEFNTWFVVTLFRDTLVREFNALGRTTLKRGDLFRAIGKGGYAYMPYEETRTLLEEVMPCVLGNLKEDLNMLKEWAKGYVEDMVRNRTLVDVEGESIGWVTCAEIGEGDIFWEMEGKGAGV